MNDNTTPISAKEYDSKINNTVPYYNEFYNQTIDLVDQCNFDSIVWLDLGCGTGTLEKLVYEKQATGELTVNSDINFVMVDPSNQMLEQAKDKLETIINNKHTKSKLVEYVCGMSTTIEYKEQFDVVTAIQAHHYMHEEERINATKRIYQALKQNGIYITFENVVPEDEELKSFELKRWAKYQQRMGKTEQEAKEHNARCGVKYFPLTVREHIDLLKKTGFSKVHVFWYSCMQMGIYGIK